MVPSPSVLGLFICERTIVEERTKNVSLINCFNALFVNQVPSNPRPFTVFATLTDGQGDGTISLVVSNVETQAEVYAVRSAVHFANRLSQVRMSLRIKRCSFPAPGLYQINLLVDGDWIAHRDVRVILRQP